MTTIAESTTTLGGMLDGIADGLVNNHGTEWSEPDADVKNDQSTEQWIDNARLLQHSTSGVYVLMYVTYSGGWNSAQNEQTVGGIRIVQSTGWNTTENHPSGKTTVKGNDPFSSQVGNLRQDSVIGNREDTGQHGFGIWPLGSETGNWDGATISSRSDAATLVEVPWWGSVGTDHISVAAYDDTDTTDGGAGWFSWEHTDAKFWADGAVPFFASQGWNHYGEDNTAMYGWQWFDSNGGDSRCDHDRTDPGAWGYINPDSDDDTYFFRRPIAYTEADIPSTYVANFIYNQETEGSDGDTITYDGTDYRLFQQTGAQESDIPAVGLRYT